MIYAGIGSRRTPADIQKLMTTAAESLSSLGWLLRSGHADAADYAFELGSSNGEIHLPWSSYNDKLPRVTGNVYAVPNFTPEIMEVAAKFHPVWWNLSDAVRKLMARNTTILLGDQLDKPVDCVICWTPAGQPIGGTGHGLRIAHHYKIPIFNLYEPEDFGRLDEFVQEKS